MVIHEHHHEQFHNSQVFIFGHGLNSLKVFVTVNSLIVPLILMAGHCCPLHLATPANHHIHNSFSTFTITHVHSLNKPNQSIIWCGSCFSCSMFSKFIPPPFHIISSIKYAEFTSSTQVWFYYWFKNVPRSLTRSSSMHFFTLIHNLSSPHHGRPSPRLIHSKSFMYLE